VFRPRRDDARNVLVAMVAELGVGYLPFALGTLRSALPPRGTAAHVHGYTLHALLAALAQARVHTCHLSRFPDLAPQTLCSSPATCSLGVGPGRG
jgi:hypothetical protein